MATRHLSLLGTLLIVSCSSSNSTPPAGSTSTDSGAPGVDASTPDAGGGGGTDASQPDTGSSCVYPAGPYGVSVGDVLPPTLSWQAYAPNATAPTTLKITDLYDCDGSKKINALVFDSAGQWCVACQYEAGNVPNWLAATGPDSGNWAALGVQIVNLVIQTNDYEPSTIVTAQQWRTQYNLSDIWVAADPTITFPTPSLPHNMLVDPRTMKVTDDLDNDSYDAAGNDDAGTGEAPDPAVAELATTNQTVK